jgi:hypothetical protein
MAHGVTPDTVAGSLMINVPLCYYANLLKTSSPVHYPGISSNTKFGHGRTCPMSPNLFFLFQGKCFLFVLLFLLRRRNLVLFIVPLSVCRCSFLIFWVANMSAETVCIKPVEFNSKTNFSVNPVPERLAMRWYDPVQQKRAFRGTTSSVYE